MRVYFLVVCMILIAVVPVVSFAQTDKEIEEARSWLGEWKRNFASPTYGVAFFRGRLEGGWYGIPNPIEDDERQFPVSTFDFRIFRGVNVSKRGGFYTGIETGVLFFTPFGDTTFTDPIIGEFHLDYKGGLVFLMAKYGLRVDIGIALVGVSLGTELGMGASLFAGGFNFYTGDKEDRSAEIGWGTSTANMGLVLDWSAEAALRLGKNFRLMAKAGLLIAPVSVPINHERERYNVWHDGSGLTVETEWGDTIDSGTREYYEAIMSRYDIDIEPFGFSVRVGFALNFS